MKLILILLIALGAGLYFPKTHAKIVEWTGPIVHPILDPIMGWSTRGEMRAISQKLEYISKTSTPFPARPKEFSAWMNENYQGSAARDAWGNLYTLKLWPDSFAVVSAGPDGQPGDGDDVLVIGQLQGDIRRQ